jgi:uncharacterized protein (TIGR00369 family)
MAGTVAAWTGLTELPETPVGSTVALSVNFLRAARGKEIVATAQVVKRGRSICFSEVSVTEADGELVANGLVTYKLG